MPLVTRQGDEGWTRDPSGRRVSKDDPVIEALGALDHLVCMLGWLATVCPEREATMVVRWQAAVNEELGGLWGADGVARGVEGLETDIAQLLPVPPSGFVTPGGGEASSRAHLVRVACRSAERAVVAAQGHGCPAIRLLNRLSDALFALAVALAQRERPSLPR